MPETRPATEIATAGWTVLGEGLLATAVQDALSESDTGRVAPIVITATDAWDLRGHQAARELSTARSVPWLPLRTELGRIVIGPAEIPGKPGCSDCVELRRALARENRRGHEAVRLRHEQVLAERPASALTDLAADFAAALVADDARRLAADPGTARTRLAIVCVDLETLQISTHRALPDPLCPYCGQAPDDTPETARIVLASRPKSAPDVYRTRALGDDLNLLTAAYVDRETGLVRSLSTDDQGGLPIAAAPMGLREGGVETGWGRTADYHTSRLTALLESLERFGGVRPGGKRTVVHAAYQEVRDRAVDPRSLGLHPPDNYRRPDFAFRPFDETRPCHWVWGYSFARREPILVPEHYGYYRIGKTDPDNPPFAYEISNGCALGGCLEEAILFGILEVAERDAFLMTWYARIPAPRINLGSARDRTVPLIAEAIAARTGYRILAFDTTVETGVPCVWAMALHPDHAAADADRSRPTAVCAAGSHLTRERAVQNALSELGPILDDLIRRYSAERERASAMVRDSSAVKTMSDHSILYGHPEAYPRLDFLMAGSRSRRFDELGDPEGFRNHDLRDDLGELLRRHLSAGLDVIVVDQTTPEHRVSGLSCVKVLIPGTLPMTFGHDRRRVHGLPRLSRVPHLLGHRDRALEAPDINPFPHPFP